MEVQLTDFENAAFTAFIVLISRVMLVFDLDFLAPLSKVDENMKRAHECDAVNKCKFWFRTHVIPEETPAPDAEAGEAQAAPKSFSPGSRRFSNTASDACEEMTMKEVMCGKEPDFPGLIPLCYAYLEHIQCDPVSFARIHQYLSFIKRRACGELMTDAAWIRKFCQEHREYKKDSVVTPGMCYDLVMACNKIGCGQRGCPQVLGDVVIEPIMKDAAFGTPLYSAAGSKDLAALLRKIAARASAAHGPQSAPSNPLRERRRRPTV